MSMWIQISPGSGEPIYVQVAAQISVAIAKGELTSGDKLPAVRTLAAELVINPNTVARSYGELEIRGIVTTQQGTGTFISDKKIEMSEVERERILSELTRSFVTKAASYGFTMGEVISYLDDLSEEKH